MTVLDLFRFIITHPLNQSAKAAALGRFARWQLASRLIDAPVVMPFVDGTALVMETGMVGATGNWYCGLLEVEEMAFMLHALRPSDMFADIGANVGSYTVMAAGAVGAQAVAVEPLPATFARLQRNIAHNRIADRVDAHCLGISAQIGELSFVSSLDAMNRVALPGENVATVKVPVTTLDHLFADKTPGFMKIDVEGHEQWVIDGGRDVLGRPALKAILMETNNSGAKFGIDDANLASKVKGFGFTAHGYDPFTRTISPVQPDAKNTIFLRDPDEMQAICRAAPRFKLVNGTI